ncbi:MAG: DUF116 domain-containing protein [Pseudomonadota bacterium]
MGRKPDISFDADDKPKKRLFIGLLIFTCLLVAGLALVLWLVPYVGLANIHPLAPVILAAVFGGVVLLMAGGVLILVLTIMLKRDIFLSAQMRGLVVKVLFPAMIIVGKLFGISRERIQQSFISINNQLVLAQRRRIPPDKMLLLMPHCLQNYDCKVKITGNVENCRRCGKCPIKDLLEFSHQYSVKLCVATGGTIARRIVVTHRPKIIIAVACERDLTSGIQDSYPLPVYGVLNRRPHGPCFNTQVDLRRVKQAMGFFLNGRQAPDNHERPPECVAPAADDGDDRALPGDSPRQAV